LRVGGACTEQRRCSDAGCGAGRDEFAPAQRLLFFTQLGIVRGLVLVCHVESSPESSTG
jgi:hypothetical protein